METAVNTKVNGHNALMTMSADDIKKAYMERVYAMGHAELFNELMRVHTESARLLMDSHKEIERIKALLGSSTSFI